MSKNIGTLLNAASSYAERSRASRLVDSWSETTAQQYQALAARLLSEVQALAGKEQAENRNPDNSPEGRFKAVKREVQTFIANLSWLGREKSTRETAIGNAFGELFILKPSTRPDQPTRDAEIRAVISQMQPNERHNTYLRASETDQTEVLRALQDAPMPLVMDEVQLRGSDERAARLQPERYKRFVDNTELLGEISMILQDALDLGREFGLDVPVSIDELGPKIRLAADYAVRHQGGRGKKVLATSAKDAAGV